MFRSFSSHYSPPKEPSLQHSYSTKSPSQNNEPTPTPATTTCDNLPKTPPTLKAKSPSYSLDNLIKESSNQSHRPQLSSRNFLLVSTGGTDQGSEIIQRSLDSFYNEHESKKKAQEDSVEKSLGAIKAHRASSISGVDPFEEQIDEFPEITPMSPFKDVEDEPDYRESPKGFKPRGFLMVQTKQVMYQTFTKASPFSRGLNSNEKSARLLDSLDELKDHHEKEKENSNKLLVNRRKVFMDREMIRNICDFLEYGDIASLNNVYLSYKEYKTFKNIFKEELLSKLVEGPNKKQQNLFLSTLLHSRGHIYEDAIAWAEHSNNPCNVANDITKDVDRTLPECEAFQSEEGRDPLLRVLMALCNTYPEMGYVQGFNSLVGVALLSLPEKEAYSLMIYLFEDLKIKQLFQNDFEGLSLLNYQLEAYLEHYLPDVFKIFKENSMNISYYTYSWFITLFADNLRLENVVKLWNFFLIKGFPFLIQFSLAIFSINRENLLKMDIDEVGPYLKSYLYDLDLNERELFITTQTFEVTSRLMKDLEHHFKEGKPRVKLVKAGEEDANWEVVSQSKSHKLRSTPDKSLKTDSNSQKWSGKKFAPFLKNVFNAVTVDFPDTVKNLFKKTTPRPDIAQGSTSANSKEDENKAKEEEEEKGGEENVLKPIELQENQPSEGHKRHSHHRLSQRLKRRSIATRLRKSMGRKLSCKQGRESLDHPYLRRDSRTPKNKENEPAEGQEDLLEINWDEIPGDTSENEDENKENDDHGNGSNTPKIYINGRKSAISETDCSHFDQEFDDAPNFVNKKRGVNEYVLKNNKSWHDEDDI